jgi:hypothetical protein
MITSHLLASLMIAQTIPAAPPAPPPRWYSVFASTNQGRCGYAVTDVVGLSAKQLRQQISKDYDRRNGFIVITNSGTSARCSDEARAVVTKLGFASVVVRPEQEADRQGGGIP